MSRLPAACLAADRQAGLAHADVQSNGWVGELLCDRLFTD